MHPLSEEFWMPGEILPKILVASCDPALFAGLQPVLMISGARIEVAESAKTALSAMVASPLPMLALLDAELPQADIGQLVAAVHASAGTPPYPIVLLSDLVPEEWHRRVAEKVLDDVIPRDQANPHWRLRLDFVLRTCDRLRELEHLREAVQRNAQTDLLTGLYNRPALLSTLFRETDRTQRLRNPLSLVLFAIDDFDHWRSRLGSKASDGLLCTIVERSRRLLRSYDTFGRSGDREFLLILPGCSTVNANLLAERLRMDVFSQPIPAIGESFRLSACFGIAASQGRSPLVVLREAELALHRAQEAGPDSIQCFVDKTDLQMDPIGFLS
jgi:two-component system, cell cycle response regulator